MALTKVSYSMITGTPVNVLDFGADPTGVADSTAALTAARDYISSQTVPSKLVFPSGIYKYSASPNWAINACEIEAIGEVRLRYTGTEYAVIFDAGAVATIFNVNFLGKFIVEGTSAAKGGFYVRSVHHSKIQGQVNGCGASYFGLTVLFSVCSEFSVNTSINEAGVWYSGAQPAGGISLSRRSAGELVTACLFTNPIIEGVSGAGIVLDYASNNTFIGGTSEGNGGAGVSLTTNSIANIFISTDFEANTGYDIYDEGTLNVYEKINSTGTVVLLGGRARLYACTINNLIDNGVSTSLLDTTYGMIGGTNTGTAAYQSRTNLYCAAGYYEQNKTYDSALTAVTSTPTATPTTVITIDPTGINGNRMYNVIAYSAGVGANYSAQAFVYRDGNTLTRIGGIDGANLAITVSGLAIKVTQTSGITLNVFAKAAAI